MHNGVRHDIRTFEDGLNVYNYVRNNPFKYRGPDERFAMCIPLFFVAFSATEAAITWVTVETIAVTVLSAGTTYLATEIYDKLDNNAKMDQNEKEAAEAKKKGKGNNNKPNSGGPPRDADSSNYLPDPAAEGEHTTLGMKDGTYDTYLQGATFDKNDKFIRRTDVTDHGRPQNHVKPHYHNANSPNGTGRNPGIPITADTIF